MVARVKIKPGHPDPDFVESLGPAFLAHLLRRISDQLVDADEIWHAERGISNSPRTSSTLLALERMEPLSVTELASVLRQSHQLVKQWLNELEALHLVARHQDSGDRRRSLLSLTEKGRAEVTRLKREIAVIDRATCALVDDVAPKLIDELWAVERDLRARPFVDRIRSASSRGDL